MILKWELVGDYQHLSKIMELGMCGLESFPKLTLQLPHPHPYSELLFELLLNDKIELLSWMLKIERNGWKPCE